MVYHSPSPFENIGSPIPSDAVSSVGTPRSMSSSLMGSPLELKMTSALPDLSPDEFTPSHETPKPPVTPSLLDSPLARKMLLPLQWSPSPIQDKHSRYYFEDK